MSKTEFVIKNVAEGQYKEALRVAKDFKIGISTEQSKMIKQAYECMVYDSRFYEQLGINVTDSINKGIEIIKSLFGSGCVA